jgi:hypothetical protein
VFSRCSDVKPPVFLTWELSFQTWKSSFQVVPLRSQAWLSSFQVILLRAIVILLRSQAWFFHPIIIPARSLAMEPSLIVTGPRFQVIGRRFIIIPDGWLTTKPVWEARVEG